jgi:hypothetical protein
MSDRVLITGATGGLGRALAQRFAADGHELILVGREAARLDELAATLRERCAVTLHTLVVDLEQPDAAEAVTAQLAERGLHVDVLVNNAGLGLYGLSAKLKPAAADALVRVNVAALVGLTQRLLPGMVARNRGGILNIASIASFQPVPLMALYGASKAFLLSYAEALADELRGTGVRVTTVCPGPFHSGFQQAAAMERSRNFQGRLPEAAQVAEAVYAAWRRGSRLTVPGLLNRVLALATRLVPTALAASIARNKVRE